MNTLLNYPDFTFTKEQLLSYQEQGVNFEANSGKGYNDFWCTHYSFNSFDMIDYQVVETPANKALFEKLAGVNLKKAKPRVHAELIQAWALDDSLVIEAYEESIKKWYEVNPAWHEDRQYRIKPSVDPEVISEGLSQGISTCKAMLVLSEEV